MNHKKHLHCSISQSSIKISLSVNLTTRPCILSSGITRKTCLPTQYIPYDFHYSHDSVFGAHMGYRKTYSRIEATFYYPNLQEVVRQRVRDCLTCARSKYTQHTAGELSSYSYSFPMEALFVDISFSLVAHKEINFS